MSETISLFCGKCGGKQFKYEGGVQTKLKDTDTVTCAGCGASGQYGPMMESVKKQAADQIRAKLGKIFK